MLFRSMIPHYVYVDAAFQIVSLGKSFIDWDIPAAEGDINVEMRMIDPDRKRSNGEIEVYYMSNYVRYVIEEDKYKTYEEFNNGWTPVIFRFSKHGMYFPSDYQKMNLIDFK